MALSHRVKRLVLTLWRSMDAVFMTRFFWSDWNKGWHQTISRELSFCCRLGSVSLMTAVFLIHEKTIKTINQSTYYHPHTHTHTHTHHPASFIHFYRLLLSFFSINCHFCFTPSLSPSFLSPASVSSSSPFLLPFLSSLLRFCLLTFFLYKNQSFIF